MLNSSEQSPNPLSIRHNFVRAELAVPENTVHKCDRNLADRIPQRTSAHHHLHLEYVPFRHGLCDYVTQNRQSVQSTMKEPIQDRV